ncbi:DEAD/DEAH box helicase [Thiohalocapsa marina]|uniref:DEAD/DEAH box helicase n=1 Tax=Thiohalocapsa marina TaxID=424902 RepID=UPI0036DE0C91
MSDPEATGGFDHLDLTEPLLRGLARAGLETPTPVQQQVVPAALDGADLLVSAVTGSGKTLAFLLPMLQRLMQEPGSATAVRGLILTPTRELARQVHAHFMRVGSYTRLTATVIIGGEKRALQTALLRRNPDILIATPGRLLEHLDSGEADLGELQCLVLDEADRMLDMGFADEVVSILARCPAERQSMLFSATLQQPGLDTLARRLLRDPQTLCVDPGREPHPDIHHQLLFSDEPEHKRRQLQWLLDNEPADKTLVFVNTRERAEQIGDWLSGQGERCAVLHGDLDQRERNRVMGLFLHGTVGVLVATDVAARGLDVPGVGRVINLDVPRCGDDYLHRTGRTGRAGQAGLAVTLVSGPEWNRMQGIQRFLRLSVQPRRIPGLEASFNGAAKRPSRSGAAAKARRQKAPSKPAGTKPPKTKDRLRDRKNIGKRRKPSSEAGLAPPRRKG